VTFAGSPWQVGVLTADEASAVTLGAVIAIVVVVIGANLQCLSSA
jgi:hypothetical protein